MKKSLMTMLAVFALLTLSVAAEAGVIAIKNATGFDIYEIYVSDSGTDNWEEDVLGQDVLENAQTLQLTVSGGYSAFDMRAADEDGNAVAWYGIPGNATSLVIYKDGTCEYQ